MKTQKKIVVFYHADCRDGFVSAGIAKIALGNKAQYQSLNYAERPYKDLKNKTIFFIDAVPELSELKKLQKNGNTVIPIDHHKTREKECREIEGAVFNLKKAGASLAWEYFFSKRKLPVYVKKVQDSDLWKNRTEGNIALLAATDLELKSLNDVKRVIKEVESKKKRQEYTQLGKKLMESTEILTKSASKLSVPVKFEGRRARVSTGVSFLRTVIAAQMYEDFPGTIAIVFYFEDGQYKVTLRAKVGSRVDLAKISEKYGGGGHKYAAGFHWPLNKSFPWKYLK